MSKDEFKEGTIPVRDYLQAYLDFVKANTEYFDKFTTFITAKEAYKKALGKDYLKN
jgi:outer membrane protein TolC